MKHCKFDPLLGGSYDVPASAEFIAEREAAAQAKAEADATDVLPDTRAARSVDAQDRLLFEINFEQENALRALRALVNTLVPGSFTNGQTVQITRAQYRDALIARWKQLNA